MTATFRWTVLVYAAAIMLGPGLGAQEQIVTTELKRLPDGRGELAVTNNSEKQTVTAFVITHESTKVGRSRPLASGFKFYDVLYQPEQHNWVDAIKPLETRRFRLGAFGSEFQNNIDLKAAVFADGTTWGDPIWVQRILECRRRYYDDLGLAIKKINNALDEGTSVESLREEFGQLRDSAPHPGPDVSLYAAAKADSSVFGTVVANLPVESPDDRRANSKLATFLPTLMTWEKIIADSKPSILDFKGAAQPGP